jgi:PKD repeat protein
VPVPTLRIAPRAILIACLMALLRSRLDAATYAAIADRELARRAPVIVLAEAAEERTRTEWIGGEEYPFTVVTLNRLEVLKGVLPEDVFRVRLPGGWSGEINWWVPGVPRFLPGQRAVLFLSPLAQHSGEYLLTELALSKFDLLEDARKARFAVRSIFQSGEERLLSADASEEVAPDEVRDLEPFLEALRAVGRGDEMPRVRYRQPSGGLLPVLPEVLRPQWVNIGGREPGGGCTSGGEPIQCLFRWFWDTGTSPEATVQVIGTQGRLSDGTDGVAHVGGAIAAWTSIPGATVRYTGPVASGNVTVNLGVTSEAGGSWTTAYTCNGGTLGVGGPRNATGPRTFKGDGSYYATRAGNVSIRQWDCAPGGLHPVNNYKAVVTHELGHTIGLGHPDQAQSTHSTTGELDWDNAVMRSTVRNSISTPQLDDIEAILYYYGASSTPAVPVADFAFGPAVASPGFPVTFSDISTNTPTSWTWSFGDGGMSSDRNPAHTYALAGTYAVTLTARNAFGSHTVSRTVTVGAPASNCGAAAFRLCFHTARFAVTLGARDQRTERLGSGQAIPQNDLFGYFSIPALTSDANNPEVFVKVLDGRPVNGSFWVFYGGLTDLEYTITVLDLATGRTRSYTKPPGESCGGFDTSAFPQTASESLAAKSGSPLAKTPALTSEEPAAAAFAACPANPAALCLNSVHTFEVTLSARDLRTGNTGGGLAIPQNDLFGYFSIPALTNNPANPEVFVKVINGTPINGKYWVFFGGLTDLEYTITVRESGTGRTKTYIKTAGSACGGFDTEAF